MIAAAATSTQSVDWLARGLAISSLIVSAVALFLGRRDTRWKRRSKGLEELRPNLRSLAQMFENHRSEPVILSMQLWSPQRQAAIAVMAESRDSLPDRRLRKRVTEAVTAVRAAQGPQQSSLHDTYEQTASPGATADTLAAAQAAAEPAILRCLKRVNKIMKRAPM